MRTAALLVLLLLLVLLVLLGGSSWVLPSTQENFDLNKLQGRWYEVAVVSTCPFYMQAQRDAPEVVTFDLHMTPAEDDVVHMTGSAPSTQGTCKQISVDLTLTNTSGRFYRHFARFNADVDLFVVNTTYDDYSMWVLLSTEQPSATATTLVKLYSRAADVRESVLSGYRALVRERGINDDLIILKENRGECEPMTTNSTV